MRFVKRSLFRFSLDHSNLNPEITESGVKNYHIKAKRSIDGYASKNFAQPNLHTVIMIHQWWGLNKSITKTAQVFASSDIRVFVPDLYRNNAANSAEEAGHKMSNLKWPEALEDLANIKHHLSANQSKDVSVVGFCMGGALTFAALASIQGWKAGGIFYGIPDLNIFRLDKIKAATIAHFGSEDPFKGFSDKQSALKLKKDCENGKHPIDVRVYEGANHAFCNQDSKYFEKNACQLAFNQTRKLIQK